MAEDQARAIRAQENAEKLRGKRAFEYYVSMGKAPTAADFGGDEAFAQKVADAVEFERNLRKSTSMDEDLSRGLNNIKGLKTQNSVQPDGSKLIEVRPEEDDDFLPMAR